MAILHLVCGLPGSGNPTLAARLEQRLGALRPTPDDWIARLYGGDGRDPDIRQRIERLQLDMALRVLRLGADVVLDNGFWPRPDRDYFRAKAAEAGAQTKLYFLDVPRLDVPREELKHRLVLRNANPPPGAFIVTNEDIDAWWPLFEPPAPDERGFTLL